VSNAFSTSIYITTFSIPCTVIALIQQATIIVPFNLNRRMLNAESIMQLLLKFAQTMQERHPAQDSSNLAAKARFRREQQPHHYAL